MRRDRFLKISEVFSRAAELDGDERVAYLDSACRDDSALRREVETLLEHDGDALPTALFEKLHVSDGPGGTDGLDAADPGQDEPPGRIGPYVVEETLGRGGMGVVYRARQQEPIRREVALKLLRRGLRSDVLLARFESEKQALAAMNHPNVAAVHDAGVTDDDRPYVAMELVRGEPLIAHCDRRRLGLRERLALFVQVCRGVQHAHQKGIIHRDLKPSNVLVATDSGAPTPKIIDFGIAKTLDRALDAVDRTTDARTLLGTPEYMSPEQALMTPGHVDTRSDVYSLGVLLYELLTGSLPIDPDTPSVFEMCRAIREDVPDRPSVRVAADGANEDERLPDGTTRARLARLLQDDLDWITMKALEKDPANRYATPTELAEDVRRHLEFEPVSAGPPGALYRVRRFVRKRRTAVAVSALVTVGAVSLLTLLTVQFVRAERETARAEREAGRATDTAEFLIGLFGTSRPFYERSGQQTIRRSLDEAVETVRSELADQPVLQARLLHAVGDAHRREKRRDRARPLLVEAHAVLARELGEDDPLTQRAAESLARLNLYSGRPDVAERMLTGILDARRRVYGEDDPRTLRSMLGVGVLLRTTGRDEEAVRLLERVREGFARLGDEHEAARLVAENNLASTYMDFGRYEDARALLEVLVERLPVVIGPQEAEVTIARYNYGCVLVNLGEIDAGLVALREAIARGFHYPGSMWQDPHVAVLHEHPEFETLERRSRLTARTWERPVAAAAAHIATGRFDDAERLLGDLLYAMGVPRRSIKPTGATVPLEMLTRLLLRRKKIEEAERVARLWIDLIEESPYLESRRLLDPLLHLAECALARGERDEALKLVDRALGIAWRPDQRAFAGAIRAAIEGQDADAVKALQDAARFGVAEADRLRYGVAFERLRGLRGYREALARMERNAL